MTEDLSLVNSNLLIKTSYKRDEDFLSDWKHRAKYDEAFLRRLIEELTKINRLDLVWKILNDPEIKRLIDKAPTSPLLSSITGEEVSESKFSCKASLATRWKKCCVLMFKAFLIILVILIVFQIFVTVFVANIALKKQNDVEKLVGEGDTVSLCNIDQIHVNTIEISEAVRKGDSGHSIKIALIPTDSLTFKVVYGLDYLNGSAIVKDLPIINEIYVYLNKGSLMHFTVWIGNGNKAKSASLYIFNDADKLNDYISYGSVDSPVFTSEIPVESKNEKISPKNTVFTSPADDYYFVILLAPEANVKYIYHVNATELVTDITQYTSDHPSCVIDTERNCTLKTSTKKYPNSQNFTLLAYATTKYDMSSKISHVHLTFTNRAYLMTLPCVILGTTVGITLLLLIIASLLILRGSVRRNRKRSGYVSIN